jgi:hypothetical protein
VHRSNQTILPQQGLVVPQQQVALQRRAIKDGFARSELRAEMDGLQARKESPLSQGRNALCGSKCEEVARGRPLTANSVACGGRPGNATRIDSIGVVVAGDNRFKFRPPQP